LAGYSRYFVRPQLALAWPLTIKPFRLPEGLEEMSANAQLQEPEYPFYPALLMAALDASPASLAVAENGRILFADRAFAATLDMPHISEIQGELLSDMLPQNTRYLDAWEPQFSPAGPMQIEALSSTFKENRRAFQVIRIRSVPLKNTNDTPRTESKKMEIIGRLTAGVAHDFNNLLTGILLYCDLLMEEVEPDGRVRRHAEAIHKAGKDGIALVQQLMSPPHEGTPEIKPLSWNQVISEMENLLSGLAGESVEIETKLAQPLGLVGLDSGQAERIILNLVINARHAIPAAGNITLSTRNFTGRVGDSEKKMQKPAPCVEFSVTDNGIGMEAKTLAKAFQPFFTTKPRSLGNGLGLTTVQDIVKRAGGVVEIESEMGKGTRVTIRMPRIAIQSN
jgi:signal transduction histidine kinase